MNGACNGKRFLAPPPEAFGRGKKVKYHLISITTSISKIFIPNFVCVLTNRRYKTYQTGFSFCRLGHALGVGLWGHWGCQGVQKFIFFKHGHVAYQIDGDDKHIRIQAKFSSLGLTGDLVVRLKGQIPVIWVTMSISKIFIPNFVCVLTNERYKAYQTVFSFCRLSHAPEVGLWGHWGCPGGQFFFFKYGHVAYQIDGDDEQN